MWLVVGAGAIGGLLAGRLAAAGEAVGVLARPSSAAALAASGLHIDMPGRDPVRVRVPVFTGADLSTAPRPDLIVVCVKAYATEDVAHMLEQALGPDVPVLSLQNGLGNEDVLATRCRTVLGGAVTISAERPQPGRIRVYHAGGGIAVPALDGRGAPAAEAVDRFRQALQRAGFDVLYAHCGRDIKWSKLLLNLMGNATSALTGLAPGRIFAHPRGFALERACMREALAAMAAAGARRVDLPGMPVRVASWLAARAPAALARPVLARTVGGRRGDKRPSLLADLQAGRSRSEADWLYGAVAAEAARLGLAAPVNAGLCRLLHRAYAREADASRFLGRPDLLAAFLLD